MKSIRKLISFIVVLVMLLIPFSPTALAASPDLCQHEHAGYDGYSHDALISYSPGDAETNNIICSIFGHKLTNYNSYFLGAEMIDMQQCEISYEDVGYCDRCEYVGYLRSTVVNHSLRTTSSRTYCIYNCGYEVWHLK